jgi:release factor glutamine methyltransferase
MVEAPARGTVAEAVERVRLTLVAAGLADARREAAELYAAVVGCAISAAWVEGDEPLGRAVSRRLEAAAARRAAGWPQAYAAGRVNFRGHWLAVDPRVLIPRPETEGLVERVLEWVRAERAVGRDEPVVADVGTGSGAIAVALALEGPLSAVVASDIAPEALEAAALNAAALGARERIRFRCGHLLEPFSGERVDAVVSNPPYVATGEWEGLDPAVRDHEPRLALDGGQDGLAVTRDLVGQASGALRPGGLLALEADARRAHETAAIVRAAGFGGVEVGADEFGRPRYVVAHQRGDGNGG